MAANECRRVVNTLRREWGGVGVLPMRLASRRDAFFRLFALGKMSFNLREPPLNSPYLREKESR